MLRNLLITLGLSCFLLLFGLFVFMPASEAQSVNVLTQLLDLPAPPPPNPLIKYDYTEKPPEFFSTETPPPDDAPIEDLIEYWMRQNSGNQVFDYNIAPSDRVLERLLEVIEKYPPLLSGFFNVLERKPQSAAAVKRIYERLLNNENIEKYQTEQIKHWLTYNSNYFSDELLKSAQEVKDSEEYVTNQRELLALAKVDFEKARPILERLVNDSNQPVSQTLARWAFYLNALKKGNSIEAGNYRDALMKTVEDKNVKPGNRDLAMDAIVDGGDFAGRDEWYFSLLEDETLHELKVGGQTFTGLTTLLMRSPPDKYADKMIELLKSNNLAVRSAAVRNLTTVLQRESDLKIITALLPWLENPNWVRSTGQARGMLVRALAQVEIPESVPGLIAVLNEKTTVDVDDEDYFSSNANVPIYSNSNTRPRSGKTREVYAYRDAAIDALIKQKNPQAAAALRAVLPEVSIWKRGDVVKAILVSGGFTIAEQIEALEIIAGETKKEQAEIAKIRESLNSVDIDEEELYLQRASAVGNSANIRIGSASRSEVFNPAEIKSLLGEQLVSIGEPSSELVSAVVFRINALEKTDPQTAEIMRGFLQNWTGAAVNIALLNYLAEGKTDITAIVNLLSLRKNLRENQINNIYEARGKGNPIAFGISACLLENESEYTTILANANDDTKIALFGCARMIRARIPVQTAAGFLKSPNKTLALAAERYIESEDSPAARQIIYALYPNEAKILGARLFFGEWKTNLRAETLSNLFTSINSSLSFPPYYYASASFKDNATEEKLRKEIRADEELLGIYAYDKNFVRIYRDKAVFSWEEDEARYFERRLSDTEYGHLRSFMATSDVNNLPPFISYCEGCQPKELVMLGRAGGRRIFLYSEPKPDFFTSLEKIFEDMRKPPATLRYWLEKDIAGAQILFADKDLQAVTVWKNGDDLRLLVNNTIRQNEIEKELNKIYQAEQENEDTDYSEIIRAHQTRRNQRAFESFSWHKFAENKLGDFANQPDGIDLSQLNHFIRINEYGGWSVKNGNVEIKSDEEAIYKTINGQTTKILTGFYSNPIITANGRWIVLTKYSEDIREGTITRINLQTNREFVVKIDKYKVAQPLVFIESANKVLIVAGNSLNYKDEINKGAYFLLDHETGAIQPAKGEFRPLLQQTFRRLQKTAKTDEVWSAIPDESKKETQIGTFNEKTFVFTPILNVPQLSFDSMQMWVDEAAKKVFIVYNGQLLSIPLRKEKIEPPKP